MSVAEQEKMAIMCIVEKKDVRQRALGIPPPCGLLGDQETVLQWGRLYRLIDMSVFYADGALSGYG